MSFALIAFIVLAYLLGSLPFALWVTKLVKGVDVRNAGSGHVTTTNTIRQAGWLPGVVVLILDIGKGFLATFLAAQYGLPDWALGLVAAATVIGHCWPIFAQFRGGMGLAAAGGSILSVFWLGFPIGIGLLVLLLLIVRHAARASVFAAGLLAPLFWVVGFRGPEFWIALGVGVILVLRFYLEDWNRKYRELWLDREKTA